MRGFCLQVTGPYACFTRPEMKVERVSYDVITPSAARAIFEAIFWKPAIRWRIKRIEVLAPIRWTSVRRNEVEKVASPRNRGIFIEDARQQRAGLFLRDVKYRLFAEFDFIPPNERSTVLNPVPQHLINKDEAEDLTKPDVRKDETEAKYASIFQRRAIKGQCFNQPYFGCREFAAAFQLVHPEKEPAGLTDECKTHELGFGMPRDLGWMLYDLDYTDQANPKPLFFRAQLDEGAIDTDRNHVEVRG